MLRNVEALSHEAHFSLRLPTAIRIYGMVYVVVQAEILGYQYTAVAKLAHSDGGHASRLQPIPLPSNLGSGNYNNNNLYWTTT